MVSCSAAAKQLLELDDSESAAAVISSYAAPLLEGCGTIRKGDLRIIGETEDLPFISVFASESLDGAKRSRIEKALLDIQDAELLKAIESSKGFVRYNFPK